MNTPNIKSFVFDTPVIAEYGERKGQTVGFLRISGTAEYSDYRFGEPFDCDYCLITITNVRAKIGMGEQDITFAWLLAKGTKSDFEDMIMNPCKAHMEYLFSENYDKYEGDYTDTVQDEQ